MTTRQFSFSIYTRRELYGVERHRVHVRVTRFFLRVDKTIASHTSASSILGIGYLFLNELTTGVTDFSRLTGESRDTDEGIPV